ncbi:TnsD family Tn7-like transposition protein, partial [Vibrio paracholerae]
QYPLKSQLVVSTYRQEEANIRERRKDWLIRLKAEGCQQARKRNGGALYAWLYRHDRVWLLRINRRYQRSHVTVNQRVDWQLRDKVCVRQLMRLLPDALDDLAAPRLSRAYYINRSKMAASVLEKHLNKLPRTRLFLNSYTESIGEYQIRR